MASAFTGLLIGSAVAAMTGYLSSQDVFASWSWRIPFLISILLGGVGLYLRLEMPESPVFREMQQQNQLESKPIRQAFHLHTKSMLVATGLVSLPALTFYSSFVYLSTYLHVYLGMPLTDALMINTGSMVFIMLVIPFFGFCADNFGLTRIISLGALSSIVLALPLYLLLNIGEVFYIFIAQIGFAVLVSLSYAAIPATLVTMFPAQIRYTAMSFSYNIANAIFGGTAPLMATLLIHVTNNKLAPAIYLMLVACFALISSLALRKKWAKVS